MDSKAQDSRFHKEFPGFRVPQVKISKIPKSVLNYMGRNDKRRANYNATRNRSFRYKSFRTQAMKLHKKLRVNKRNILGEYSSHFKYSLRVNEKNILTDYHPFF